MKKFLGILGLLVLVGLLIFVFVTRGKIFSPATESSRVQASATFYSIWFLASQIATDMANVSSITSPGVEPHDYEPTPQDIISAQNSDIFFFNGAGLDPWAERIAPELEKKGVRVKNLSQTADILPFETREHEAENIEESNHGNFDPHFWLDPVSAIKMVQAMEKEFIAADPDNDFKYTYNSDRAQLRLENLDKRYRTELKNCRIREIVVSHNAFQYLGNRYNFKIHSLSGMTPLEEPTPQYLAELTELLKEKNIKFVFTETLASQAFIQTLVREAGVLVLVLNPIEGITQLEESQENNYFTLMESNLENLKKGMECVEVK